MCCELKKERSLEEWCGCGNVVNRRFISKKEEEENLKKYKEQLEKEIAGVEEHIQELKGK